MTISSTTRKAGPFTGNGAATSFPFGFKVFDKTDVQCVLTSAAGVDSTLTLDSDYSVTLNSNQDSTPGGTVTYPISGGPMVSPVQLTVLGDLDQLQETDLTNNGGFYPKVIEDALDRAVVLIQQLNEIASRAIRISASDSTTGQQLPTSAVRANKALIFDANGNVELSSENYLEPSQAVAEATQTVLTTAEALIAGITTPTANTWTPIVLVDGVDYTSGVSTSVALPATTYQKNITSVVFDGITQMDGYGLLSQTQLGFSSPIPAGVSKILIGYGSPFNMGSYTAFGANARTRPFQDRLRDQMTLNDFASVAAAAATGYHLLVPAGAFPVNSNVTFNAPVRFLKGGKLVIGAGVAITFNGTIDAGVYQIFDVSAGGTVVINPSTAALVGCPEWWGADTTSVSADNKAALEAAHIACPVLQLQAADYWVSTGVRFNTPNHIVMGVVNHFTSGSQCSRIVSRSATADVVTIGPLSQPGSIPAFTAAISVLRLQATRAAAPNIASNCKGFRFQFCQFSRLENCYSSESMVGFYYTGLVETKTLDNDGSRVQAGAGAGTDYFQGHFFDGSINIGTSGGSASLYVLRPHAGCGNAAVPSTGMLINGNFSDLWIDTPEVGATTQPINIIGNSNTGTIVDDGNLDLTIMNPICDQYGSTGISVSNISKFGVVKIRGGYASPKAGSSPLAAFYVSNSFGVVEWTDGEYVMNNIAGYGTYVNGSRGVVSRNKNIESQSVGTYLLNANDCDVYDTIVNQSVAAAQPAVLLTGSTGNRVMPRVYGGATKRPSGVLLSDVGSTTNEINVSGIDGGMLTGGKVNAVVVTTASGAVPVSAPGRVNGNVVSGVTSATAFVPVVQSLSVTPAANTDYSVSATCVAPVDGTFRVRATGEFSGGSTPVLSVLANASTVMGPLGYGGGSSLVYTLHVTAAASTVFAAVYHSGASAGTALEVILEVDFTPD